MGLLCGPFIFNLKWKATPVGFEPTQGDPIGLAGRRLSHSAKVSCQMACVLSLRHGRICTRLRLAANQDSGDAFLGGTARNGYTLPNKIPNRS